MIWRALTQRSPATDLALLQRLRGGGTFSLALRLLGGSVMASSLKGKLGPYPMELSEEERDFGPFLISEHQTRYMLKFDMLLCFPTSRGKGNDGFITLYGFVSDIQVPINEVNSLLRQHAGLMTLVHEHTKQTSERHTAELQQKKNF